MSIWALLSVSRLGGGHVFAGQAPRDDGVVVVIHPAPSQVHVEEGGGIAGREDVRPKIQFHLLLETNFKIFVLPCFELGVDPESPSLFIQFQI